MLGIKITHHPNSITLSQSHYIDSLLELYGMSECKPMATPLIPNSHLKEAFLTLNINYYSVIGSLSYLSTAKRPDLSFLVSTLSQFLESPRIQHWQVFLHVLKYLKGTSTIELTYDRHSKGPPMPIGETVACPGIWS
ncbi:hypothetical protein O181_082334 [Austropuccinia psidii MF-1]|uniref:Reverse transcriptase Ty1/copia-type domain-containing protein n=1 Tax=Austropuccinia psidii MF-1 TaxID=1389203 RepID=A0A9Q3IKY4_9BASI|nr:hypothetical protein [Austropuccinia psidii MF-1]